jgi:hypothetical protein
MALTNETLELDMWKLEQGYIIKYLYVVYKILMENRQLKNCAMKNFWVYTRQIECKVTTSQKQNKTTIIAYTNICVEMKHFGKVNYAL